MKLTLLALIISLNIYGQSHPVAYNRIEFGLETMIQSQVNIGGIIVRRVDSQNGTINAKNLMISPSLGLLIRYNINDLSSITTGARLNQYKAKLEFNYKYDGTEVDENVRINRNVLEIPFIYSRKLSKKIMVGAGIGLCFDEIGRVSLSGKGKGITNNEVEYLFTFGDGYRSFSLIAQGEYKLNRRWTLLAGFNLETINKRAFDIAYTITDDKSSNTFDYTYKPYTLRYSVGLKIKLFGTEKKHITDGAAKGDFAIEQSPASFPSSQTDGKYYTVNGYKIWTVSFGKGDPLFFIAGGPGGTHYGLRSFDSLAATNTLVYFDGLGRGKSDTAKNITEYTLARDIEDLNALRIAMGFTKINVLGHSYGGLVAQGFAIKYPDNTKHLIIANSFHSFVMWQENDDNSNHEIKTNYPEVWESLMQAREKGAVSSDQIHQEIYGKVPYGFLYAYNPDNFTSRGRKPYPNSFNSRLYYQMVGKDGDFIVGSDIGNFDFRTQLKDLKMPILIIGGRYDRVAVPSMMVKYKTYCPQAQFVMFENSGHNPQVEQPAEEFSLIRSFLSR